ncbi:MAG: hypothetical protein H7222_09070 [Methylotenera sp.]|nr:hypothetical protein [Oligoflexia bacterium]
MENIKKPDAEANVLNTSGAEMPDPDSKKSGETEESLKQAFEGLKIKVADAGKKTEKKAS